MRSDRIVVFLGLSQRIHGSSFLFPRYIDSATAGPEGAKNLAGKMSSA
jgi:hypothetical protein